MGRETGPAYYDEDFFQQLPQEKIAFVEASIQRKLDKHEYLYMEGDLATAMFYIVAGTLKASQINKEGKEIILYMHKAGSLIGLSGALHGGYRIANAQAITPCEVYEIGIDVLRALLLRYPSLADRALTMLVRRVSFLTDRYLAGMYDNAASRLRVFLAQLYYEQLTDMKANKQGQSIPLQINQEAMASMVGVSRQTVNQLLHNLARDRIIKIHRDKIIFLNPDYLLNAVGI